LEVGSIDTKHKYWKARSEKCAAALEKKGFNVSCCDDATAAREEVIRIAGQPETVGFGGSQTTRVLGLVEYFRDQGCQIFDHWVEGLSKEESSKVRRAQLTSDVFLASANALTMDGCIINLDGFGNRVSASIFGPKKIILVVSANKITNSVEEGINRARQVAAPLNYMGKERNTPCAITGECIGCQMPRKECRVLTIVEGVPKGSPNYHIVIVAKDIGF